jgi:hypothetical protein
MASAAHPQHFGDDLLEIVPGLVVDRVPVTDPARPEDRLNGLGLTHRAGAADPWHDAGTGQFDRRTGARNFEEKEFCCFNGELKDTYFHHIYRSLPFRVGRMRLVALHPGEINHVHAETSRVAHLAITTNEDCRLLFRTGDTYYVPLDGRVHLLDTTRHHSAYNAGATIRIHLTMARAEDPAVTTARP